LNSNDGSDISVGAAEMAFATRAAIDDAWPTGSPLVGVGEIVQLLADPMQPISLALHRQILADPRLAETWRHLKSERTVATLPTRAAAGTGTLIERRFTQGLISIVPSSATGQVYVKIRWHPDLAMVPRTLLLEQDGVPRLKRALPRLRSGQEFIMICVTDREPDAEFLRLLGDPRTSGTFLT
jgi:hypothetical protein